MNKKQIVDTIYDEFYGNGNYMEAFGLAADKILAEIDKEKPTSPDLLVEELARFSSRLYDARVSLYGPEVASELVDIISRYPPKFQDDIVLWEGMCKVGETDFMVFKGKGDNESVCLVPVPYKLIKHHKGKIIFRKCEGEK